MSLLSQKFKFLRKKNVSPSGHQITEDGGREWENFYRDPCMTAAMRPLVLYDP